MPTNTQQMKHVVYTTQFLVYIYSKPELARCWQLKSYSRNMSTLGVNYYQINQTISSQMDIKRATDIYVTALSLRVHPTTHHTSLSPSRQSSKTGKEMSYHKFTSISILHLPRELSYTTSYSLYAMALTDVARSLHGFFTNIIKALKRQMNDSYWQRCSDEYRSVTNQLNYIHQLIQKWICFIADNSGGSNVDTLQWTSLL